MPKISKTSLAIWGLFALVVVGAAVAFFSASGPEGAPGPSSVLNAPLLPEIPAEAAPGGEASAKAGKAVRTKKGAPAQDAGEAREDDAEPDDLAPVDNDPANDEGGEAPTAAEKAVQEWTDLIDSFRNADPPKKATTADRARAKAKFDALADDDRDENIHHAMNLLPDESVELVYDILFDKTEPADVIDVIFSDILNRDESIKNPVMKQIAADREHPSWFESVRILDIVLEDDEKAAVFAPPDPEGN